MNNCPEIQDKIEQGGYSLDWLTSHQRTCQYCRANSGNIAPNFEEPYNPPPPELDDFPYENEVVNDLFR